MEELKLSDKFEVKIPHRSDDDKKTRLNAEEEYLLLQGIPCVTSVYAKPLRWGGSSTWAHRTYDVVNQEMWDIRKELKKHCSKLKPRLNFPQYIPGTPLGISKYDRAKGGQKSKVWLSHLERCTLNGVRMWANEVKSVSQAYYVYPLLEQGLPIDMEEFARLEKEGVHIDELAPPFPFKLVEHSTAPSDGDVEHSNAPAPIRSNPLRDKFPHGFKSNYLKLPPTDQRPMEHSTAPSCALVEHSSALPEILETVRRIESKVDNLAVIHDPSISSDLSKLEEITDQVISEVVGRQVNKMDKGFNFNKDTESYMMRVLERVEELYEQYKSYRQVYPLIESELNTSTTELGGFHTDLSNARLGSLKGKPFTEHDIKRCHTKYFFIAEVKNIRTGEVTRRLMRMYTNEEE